LKCGRSTEKIENVAGPHLKKCPHCGGKVESVITAPSFQFKGAGWYVNDYGAKKTAAADGDKADKPATETKETANKEKGTAAKETASKESSPNESKDKKPAKKK
jgi:putative FmdB family regulatory protein